MFYDSNYPDILLANLDKNPELWSPNSDYHISFALTKEGSYDLEEYKAFLDASIREFRHSRTYKHYKAYLYSIGLDFCQFHPYIQCNDEEDMASLEMHHCMLNIYDIAIIITEHILNTVGSITEFDLSELLRIEHINNRIPLVMLCKTCHQLYHHKYMYVHPEMIFGKWWELLEQYKAGWTRETMEKVIRYLNRGLGEKFKYRKDEIDYLLRLRDDIKDWSGVEVKTNDFSSDNEKD